MDPNNNQQMMTQLPQSNNAFMPYGNRAMEETRNYYNPYTSAGADPAAQLMHMQQSFQQSPGQLRANEQKMRQLQGTAMAQGRFRSPGHLEESGDLASSLYNQDMQQYIQNFLQQQQLGLQGAQGASGDINNILGTQGSYAENAQQQKEKDKRALISSIMQALGMAGGAVVGGYTGGPVGAFQGAAAGGKLGSALAGGGSDNAAQPNNMSGIPNKWMSSRNQ
jgi:hypothetical protein